MTVKLQQFNDASQSSDPVFEETLGRYMDDGKGVDEVPGDGILTAEAVLDVPAGKYRALFSTGNEVFSRAQSQQVLLYPWPVSYSLNPPSGEGGAKLSLVIDVDELDPASVVIQGKAIDGGGSSMTFNEVATAPRFGVDLSALKAAGQYLSLIHI